MSFKIDQNSLIDFKRILGEKIVKVRLEQDYKRVYLIFESGKDMLFGGINEVQLDGKFFEKENKICKHCQTENDKENIFCPKCGNKFLNKKDKTSFKMGISAEDDFSTEIQMIYEEAKIVERVLSELNSAAPKQQWPRSQCRYCWIEDLD